MNHSNLVHKRRPPQPAVRLFRADSVGVFAAKIHQQIAQELGISDDTVKGHVSNILAKLHASDRTHAVTLAIKRGLIQL